MSETSAAYRRLGKPGLKLAAFMLLVGCSSVPQTKLPEAHSPDPAISSRILYLNPNGKFTAQNIDLIKRLRFAQAFELRDLSMYPVQEPTVLRRDPPLFPSALRVSGFKGEVVVCFIIDENGNVSEAAIDDSSDARLNQAALDCIRQWKFVPKQVNGMPVRGIYSQSLEFAY